MATAVLIPAKTRPGVVYPHAQWYFLLAIVITWVGFARSYFAVIRTEPLLHHIHGALMGGWIALLIVQPILYQRGKFRLHRTLGRWGAFVLIPAMIVVGCLMVRRMLRGHELPPFIAVYLAFLDVASLIELPLYVGMAIATGKRVQEHARWISCTVVTLLPPALARALPIMPVFRHNFVLNVNLTMALMCVVYLVLMVDDRRKAGRIYSPYPVALALTAVPTVCANLAGQWGWWHWMTDAIRQS
ncbi:hypothetical protein [Terriglobus aquaticus]|uniref:Uncharacterized protein n=1 Tax=Terriglobus aquaticus TaxID=940139 RepID=A0ABW9KM91_9BACT|nr:hypothetical protein [Terriglobus aquaticus]